MHDTAFDSLTRAIGTGVSRRGMLRAVAGGGLSVGLLGWTAEQSAAAKNCKKIKDKKKRKKCFAKAQGTTAQLPAPPPSPGCVPESPVTTCNGRCGTFPNSCGQFVTCPACTDGQQCLSNGSCATVCSAALSCRSGCECSPSVEGPSHCRPFPLTCEQAPQSCTRTAECPLNHQCQETGCGSTRCVPLC